MAELGPTSDELHAHVGAHVALLGTIDSLVAIGTDSDVEALASSFEARRGTDSLVRFDDVASAIAQLDRWLDASGATLVKASNSSGLSRLAAAIVERHGMQASTPPAAQDDRP
jgi:UDP-N-acetylmuramyl pentapeptide synthase